MKIRYRRIESNSWHKPWKTVKQAELETRLQSEKQIPFHRLNQKDYYVIYKVEEIHVVNGLDRSYTRRRYTKSITKLSGKGNLEKIKIWGKGHYKDRDDKEKALRLDIRYGIIVFKKDLGQTYFIFKANLEETKKMLRLRKKAEKLYKQYSELNTKARKAYREYYDNLNEYQELEEEQANKA